LPASRFGFLAIHQRTEITLLPPAHEPFSQQTLRV